VVLAGALGLRLWGIGFGLPDLYHPDEPAYVLQALAVGRGLPNGLTFANPPLYKYMLLGEYAVDFGVRRLAGSTRSAQDFVDQFRGDPSTLYLIARATSAVFGALTSLAAFALGASTRGQRAGLIAAGLTAVTYLLARDSHFGVNDALVTLLLTVGLVFCVRIARDGRRRDYLIAGALAGLAFAAKYQGIALLIPLMVGHLTHRSPRRSLDLAAALGALAVAAVATFPSLLSETGRVLQDIYVHLYLEAVGGYDGLDPAGGYAFYARALVLGLGWPLLIAALVGVVIGIWRRDRLSLVIASLPLTLLLVLGAQQLYFARFLLPALPALIVEAALALDALVAIRPAIGVVLALLVGAPTLADAVRFDALLSREDTRTLAREWISANVPNQATVAVDSAPLGPSLPATGATDVLVANDWSLFDLSPPDYQARGVEYLVVSSFTSEVRLVDPARDARRVAFYGALPNEATPVAEFRPYSGAEPPFVYDQIYGPFNALDQLERPGPTITVYRFNFARVSAGRDTPP
jgi:hypothetical protein